MLEHRRWLQFGAGRCAQSPIDMIAADGSAVVPCEYSVRIGCHARARADHASGAAHRWALTSASASNIAGVCSRRAIVRAPSRAATKTAALEDARAAAKPHPLKCAAIISVETTNPRATRWVSSASSAGSSFARFCIRHPYWKSEATISAAIWLGVETESRGQIRVP